MFKLAQPRFLSSLRRNPNFNKLFFSISPLVISKYDTSLKLRNITFPSPNKKFNTLTSFTRQNASYFGARQFHTNHVLREPTIATSEFKVLITRELILIGIIAVSFFVVFWFWDSERDGVYFQVVDSQRLDANAWFETLVNGQSQSTVKLNGKIMLKRKPAKSFNKKPMETTPTSSDEILLIHYFLTCFRTKGTGSGLTSLQFSTHNFYLARNSPLVIKFLDPTNPSKEIIVDFHINKEIIGTSNGKIQQGETLLHLNTERVILGNGIDRFLDETDSVAGLLNGKGKQDWTWKKEPTLNNQKLQENVLRNGKLSFVGGQFRKGKDGKLEFHCSWISDKPEQEFIKELPIKWYEKM